MSEIDTNQLRQHVCDDYIASGLLGDAADEIERLRSAIHGKQGWAAEYERLRQQVAELQDEVAKWKRIRTPGHGPCCTCQVCGLPHDECRCDLDDVADDAAQAEEKAVSLQVIVDRLRNALLNIRAAHYSDGAVYVVDVLGIIEAALLPDKSKSTEGES